MSKYASLLFPVEEYHEIGPFRFPILHDLVPGEAKGLEAINKKQAKHTFTSIKLAQRIAKDRDITTKEAIDLLAEGAESEEIFYEYAEEMEQLQALNLSAIDTKIAVATLLMKYRGEIKTPEAEEWKKVPDWSDVDSEVIPSKVLDEIMQFVEWERTSWPDAEGKSPESVPEQNKLPLKRS